eukprot:6173519-Pleurochrysis_carterae.AAC.2
MCVRMCVLAYGRAYGLRPWASQWDEHSCVDRRGTAIALGWLGQTCDSDGHVERVLHHAAASDLGEAVALHERAVERGAHPLLHLGRDGAAAREGHLQVAAGARLELLEQHGEKGRGAALQVGRRLPAHREADQELGERARLVHLGHRASLDRLPHLGHAHHDRWLELLEAAGRVGALRPGEQRLRVSVANLVARHEVVHLADKLKDVREG